MRPSAAEMGCIALASFAHTPTSVQHRIPRLINTTALGIKLGNLPYRRPLLFVARLPAFLCKCCANHTPHLVHRNAQIAQIAQKRTTWPQRTTCTETHNLHRNAQLAQKPPTLEKSPDAKPRAVVLRSYEKGP